MADEYFQRIHQIMSLLDDENVEIIGAMKKFGPRNPGITRHLHLAQPCEDRISPINGSTDPDPRSRGYGQRSPEDSRLLALDRKMHGRMQRILLTARRPGRKQTGLCPVLGSNRLI